MAREVVLLLVALLAASAAATASSCKVTDPLNNAKYDLTGLRRSSGVNYQASHGNFTYLLNPCGAVLEQTVRVGGVDKKCEKDSGSCQIDIKNSDQTVKDIGFFHDVTVSAVGELTMTMTEGTTCKSGKARQTTILFSCDKGVSGTGKPEFVSETIRCQYLFMWRTPFACPTTASAPTSTPPKSCSVENPADGTLYDLAPLARRTGNYLVEDGNLRYWLNVCEDVHLNSVGAGYSVAMTRTDDDSYVRKLGRTNNKIEFNPSFLKQELINGDTCDNDDDDTYSALIIYTCDPDESIGAPKFIEIIDDCQYVFEWSTSAACAVEELPFCSAEDPVTDKIVSLQALHRTPADHENWEAQSAVGDGDDYDYFLNICGALLPEENPCRSNSAVCQVPVNNPSAGRTLGMVATLKAYNGDVIYSFRDGDRCKNGARASVDIYFTCDKSSLGKPKLLSVSDDCKFLFSWHSSAACEYTPSSGGLSAGAIAAIVMTVLAATYFGVGAAYNFFVKKETGIRVIPHWDLFVAGYYTMTEWCKPSRPSAIQL